MNELLFLLHVIALMTFVIAALRLGKEALMACLGMQIVLANLFVMKQMTCFGLTITCSEVYTVGSLFSMNLIQSYFGKKAANRTVIVVFLLLTFVIIMSRFHLRYLPSPHDRGGPAFALILGQTPRIMLTSLISALMAQKLDMELFARFKKRLPFFLPFICASLITQLFDTLFFSYVALYSVAHSMRDIVVMSYITKVIVIATMAPFTLFVKKWIRHDSVQV